MARKIIRVERLTLADMIREATYHGLADDLRLFPVPDTFMVGKKKYPVPGDFEAFSRALCYGQRLYMAREEKNDFTAILRIVGGFYYPVVTGLKWDEDRAVLFGKNIITCKVVELYPVAMLLIEYMAVLIKRESRLLQRELSKTERAAGVEKLAPFSELISLDFLRDVMKITVPEVLLTPYNECLVRFMLHKEIEDYRERYTDLLRIEAETKQKKRGFKT